MNLTIYARMENPGQCAYRFQLPWEKILPEKIRITGDFLESGEEKALKAKTGMNSGDVLSAEIKDGLLTVDVNPVSMRLEFSLELDDTVIPKEEFDEVITDHLDEFEKLQRDDVVYRLRDPKLPGKHPLILYLHGGGNGGVNDERDNTKQLIADYGPVNFAADFPDFYIMAPQTKQLPPKEMQKMLGSFRAQSFFKSGDAPDTGWNREYLAKVCELIRELIREGEVDEKRVYVTGLSMGGAGTIRAMHVGADLFAAAAPVCPTMTQETFNLLRTTRMPVWVSTSYVDHTIYRHKYIVDAIMQLKDEGHQNAHLTLYAPEELAKYNIALDPEMTHEQRFSKNHMSWVLTYHNEYGIMSWLTNQVKE